ncbi:hypothetical protein GCM10023322_62980 [Rugosimonospora acidiphila]|uniref:Uncharacterized protein n=1 Tax=Rugosimonospora acidiphila TaxID=556531 RepID=A0ABP9SG59_9ACTN
MSSKDRTGGGAGALLRDPAIRRDIRARGPIPYGDVRGIRTRWSRTVAPAARVGGASFLVIGHSAESAWDVRRVAGTHHVEWGMRSTYTVPR